MLAAIILKFLPLSRDKTSYYPFSKHAYLMCFFKYLRFEYLYLNFARELVFSVQKQQRRIEPQTSKQCCLLNTLISWLVQRIFGLLHSTAWLMSLQISKCHLQSFILLIQIEIDAFGANANLASQVIFFWMILMLKKVLVTYYVIYFAHLHKPISHLV